jgi:hypothetical protein
MCRSAQSAGAGKTEGLLMTRRRAVMLGLFLAAIVLGGWLAVMRGGDAERQPPAPRAMGADGIVRVLFIGNSLTVGNDLPALVSSLSRSGGKAPVIEAESHVAMGADLGDHWRNGARQRIEEGDWDVVVLQQGPSSLPESRAALLEYARTYEPVIRAAGARTAFYMVWPEEQHLRSFDRTCESYRLAAEEVDALLLPAGEAWRAAWRRDPAMPLYGPDRFHPSLLGSYLTALVMTAELTGRSPLDLASPEDLDPPLSLGHRVTASQIHLAKEAAAEVSPAKPASSPAFGDAARD